MIIQITPEFVSVKYGISKQKKSPGGIFKSVTWIHPLPFHMVQVYAYDELAFSTQNPDEVMKVIKEWSKPQ